jgi:hypothetical protein
MTSCQLHLVLRTQVFFAELYVKQSVRLAILRPVTADHLPCAFYFPVRVCGAGRRSSLTVCPQGKTKDHAGPTTQLKPCGMGAFVPTWWDLSLFKGPLCPADGGWRKPETAKGDSLHRSEARMKL